MGEFESSQKLNRFERVIIKTERGLENGEVLCPSTPVAVAYLAEPTSGQVVRIMNAEDDARAAHVRELQKKEYEVGREMIAQHHLAMQLIDVEHLFGGERIVFYFLAEKRVDFRELVKDLAAGTRKPALNCGRSASATKPSCWPTMAIAANRSAATHTWPSCRRCRCGWPSCRNRRSTRRKSPAAAAGSSAVCASSRTSTRNSRRRLPPVGSRVVTRQRTGESPGPGNPGPHGSLALAETIAHAYEEMNRETKYFDSLVRLFDLYLSSTQLKKACETLDRLVDIDPYDYRNQERIAKLEGRVDPAFLQNVLSRAAKAATVSTRTDGFTGAGSEASSTAGPATEEARAAQALEDLVVQVEIFLQYSLQSKAVERLERIAELFPGQEDSNERLRALYERANWWPKGAPRKAAPPAARPAPVEAAPAPPPAPAPMPAETHRDLATIAEINRLMYRQSTPRELIASTAAEIGKYLQVARCMIAVGAAGETPQLTAEYFAPGTLAAGTARIPSIISLAAKAPPDALGGIELRAATTPALRDLGLESALAVELTDKESQAPGGVLLVGDASERKWKPNESFFLQAVGDQLVMSVNHTRLRSLVRSLAVADEKTGLLSRGAYIDCLLVESNRARTQGTPLSLVIVQIDRGGELLREHGDSAVEQYVEQLARALSSAVRQTDIAVKYTAWSLVFVLPNTTLENARALAEKLRQVAGTVTPPWGETDLTASAIVAEASSRPSDETEDRVTEWINRAEAGLDEARLHGGNVLVPLATP